MDTTLAGTVGPPRTDTSILPPSCVYRAQVLWDYRGLVGATYDAWKTALWAAINTEALEDANKKIAVELKRLGDASVIVKGWTAYRDLDSAIRDMATSLPLVNELHSPAMRPRHWKELAVVCGVKNLDPADPKFCLEVSNVYVCVCVVT